MIKKQKILIIVTAAVIALLALSYFFAVRPFVNSRLPAEVAPETLEGEELGISNRYYMYSELSRDEISSIEVNNENGKYRFVKNGSELVIEGYEGTAVDASMLSSLVTTCGSTLTKAKVMDNASDEKLDEYGLSEPRAYWTVTDNDGKQYKVYVGRELLTGGGYYCMFAGRRSVYVLDTALANSVLCPVESYVTPYILVGVSADDYYNIDDFSVYNRDGKFISVGKLSSSQMTNQNALAEHILTYPAPYAPNATKLYTIFMSFSSLKGESVYKLGADDASLEKCGLGDPEYMVSFKYDSKDYFFLVSALNEDGYYYVVSNVYSDIISKVPRETLDFLDYGMMDWISHYIFQSYITSVSEITVETPNINATFKLSHGIDESGAQTLAVEMPDGSVISGKNEVKNFRQYYGSLLSIDIRDYLPETVPESGVKISDIVSDNEKCDLTMTVKGLDGKKTVYQFYRYSTRRSAAKVNGNAEFYVPSDIIEKIERDTFRIINGETVDPYSEN